MPGNPRLILPAPLIATKRSTPMKSSNNWAFLAKSVAVGVVIAVGLLIVYPNLISQRSPSQPSTTGEAPQIDTVPNVTVVAPTLSFAKAVQLAAPAVVNIYSTKVVSSRTNPLLDEGIFNRLYQDKLNSVPRQRLESSLGSGVIISGEGYILTNNHVIQSADEILVALKDGRNANAKLVGSDPESDLAVLKISLDSLPSITLADSDQSLVGDIVLAIGNPFGIGQTVTMGIISAIGRTHLGINTFENFIQTDAAINRGNSGGALINSKGQLIGINSAIYSKSGGYQGIGFAIPSNFTEEVLTQIITYGHVVRGWIGIQLRDITPELTASFNLPSVQGTFVSGVYRNSPAHLFGIKQGDIITRIGNQPVKSASEVLRIISTTKPGETLSMAVVRDSLELLIDVAIKERPAPSTGHYDGS